MTARDAFIAFVSAAEDVAALKSFATSANLPDQQVFQGGIPEACDYLKNKQPPQLLMVEVPSAEAAPALLDQLANVVDAQTKVVVVGTVNEYSFFTWLTEIGIAYYLLRPLKPETVLAAYQKTLATPTTQHTKDKAPGKVIAYIGSKGGVGASSLALLSAALMAKHSTANVALVDIDAQDGAISALLDLQPSHGFHEALEKPDRIDELLLDRLSLKAAERLSVISAEESYATQFTVHPDAAPKLIAALRAKYDVVILDIADVITPLHKHALRLSDQLVLVTDQTLLALRGAMRVMDFLTEAKLPMPQLIINKSGQYEKHEVGEVDIEKSLKLKPSATINNAPQIFMEIDAELKVLKQEDHVVIRTLKTFALALLPEGATADGGEAPKAKKPALGFLKKK